MTYRQFSYNNNKKNMAELEKTFESEIKGIKDQMMDFDDTLVEEE